jgi:hypothetical protein
MTFLKNFVFTLLINIIVGIIFLGAFILIGRNDAKYSDTLLLGLLIFLFTFSVLYSI